MGFADSGTIPFQPAQVSFELPDWVEDYCRAYSRSEVVDARMAYVIGAAAQNIENGTGGPFAAAVFEIETGALVSLGVNLVMPQGLSMLHAEMVAISLAQRKLGVHDLSSEGLPAYELVTSTEPCAMCFGAIPWSGVRRVVTGAVSQDARDIGFDEGDKPANWVESLQRRGIGVLREQQRGAAKAILDAYLQANGAVYSPDKSS
ncbi:MAG: nucleoside deaminase [Gammaproteobacteria bacterium]|nr:nucleoside deaminase [Gammaproteobacteria bacterium]MCP5135792.1 nucleoside deaminase [Gammaproteobacteria bacterium]